MKIESKDLKLKNIFERKQYIIPDYQRNYSWSIEEEISIFWDDFLYYLNKYDKNENSNFFIGPMVYKGENINASKFEVIDGQQRLITIAVLLSVVISFFRKYKKNNLANGLKQYLIFKDEKDRGQLAIITMEPHPFFQKKIFHADSSASPSKKSEKLIEKARKYFEDSIEKNLKEFSSKNKKEEYLEKIRDSIFNIDTVIIVSDDETDAFTIFETINTRGKNLSSLDLLKNYIFKNSTNKTGIEEPKTTWKKIVDNIEIERDSFFNRFWASWVGKITENKLYRRFTDYMRSPKNEKFKDTSILLNELLTGSVIYKKTTAPSLDDWKKDKNYHIYWHIKNINGLFKLKVHYAFFLALFEEFEKKRLKLELLNKTLLLMENFHFIFTHIVSPSASGLDNKYSKFAIRIREETNKNKVISDLRNDLLEKIPQKEEYIENFKQLTFKDKDTVKFILLRLEKEKDPSITLDFELHSIEHLEPKTKRVPEVNDIGNLFLLEEEYNNKKDRLSPFENYGKNNECVIDYLQRETKYKTTKSGFKKIIKLGKWSSKEIKGRTETLAKETYKLFSKL